MIEKFMYEWKDMKNKLYLKIAGLAICALLVFAVVCLLKYTSSQSREIKELESKLEEMESKKIQVDTIREEVKQISKYSAYEYNYTSVIHFSDSNTFIGFQIPLTGNNFIATIDGTMDIGINGEEVVFDETKDTEGNITAVTITVPHSEIQDNHTIQETLEIYDEKHNIFNPVKVADYHALILEAEEKEKKKVLESDLLQKSDERISYLLTAYFQRVYGEDVKITCQYAEL